MSRHAVWYKHTNVWQQPAACRLTSSTMKSEAADCVEVLLSFYQTSQRQSTKTVFFKVPAARTYNVMLYNHSEITFREYGYQQRGGTFFRRSWGSDYIEI
jgi:hypothetical protein